MLDVGVLRGDHFSYHRPHIDQVSVREYEYSALLYLARHGEDFDGGPHTHTPTPHPHPDPNPSPSPNLSPHPYPNPEQAGSSSTTPSAMWCYCPSRARW